MCSENKISVYDKYNQYIKKYMEERHVNGAIMLTGKWGVGKSYYIKNSLMPYLKENGYQGVVVSMYGLSTLEQLSRAVFFSLYIRVGKKAAAGLVVGKTILSNILAFKGVSLVMPNVRDLKKLLKKIDLSGKLLIFEDVERSKIDKLDWLGYINNLVEQDGIKVLVVANEDKIADSIQPQQANLFAPAGEQPKDKYQKTNLYRTIKEKTIQHTIVFKGDFSAAAKSIICEFNNEYLNTYILPTFDEDMESIGYISSSQQQVNLRSFEFACGSCAEIFEQLMACARQYMVKEYQYFIKCVFYGTLTYCLKERDGKHQDWQGNNYLSGYLGSGYFPLFKFCYDYLNTQNFDPKQIDGAVDELNEKWCYDTRKDWNDKDIATLSQFYILSEEEIKKAFNSILIRLDTKIKLNDNDGSILFLDYVRILCDCLYIKYEADIDLNTDALKEKMLRNIRGFEDYLNFDAEFGTRKEVENEKVQQEMQCFKEQVQQAKDNIAEIYPGFVYLPEQVEMLYSKIVEKKQYKVERRFIKYLNISEFVDMYFQCNTKQKDDVRIIFDRMYRASNIKAYYEADIPIIKDLLATISRGIEENRQGNDKIQTMQCRWFKKKLEDILNRLQ